jgi:CubicO group peptidase (beta-lactamase class C family)
MLSLKTRRAQGKLNPKKMSRSHPMITAPTIDRRSALVSIAALSCGSLCLTKVAAETASSAAPKVAVSDPASCGLNAERLAEMDGIVATALEEKRMPGCVVAIGRKGKIARLTAHGNKQLEPESRAMTTDTVFDLASLTKPIATATSVMLLVERGKLEISEPVGKHLPDFAVAGKENVTVEQLLLHVSGLIPDNALADYRDGPQRAWERIFALKLQSPPGEKFSYSDVNFLVLGKLVETLAGCDLNRFTRSNVYEPLGMAETGYLPAAKLRARAAPTQQREGHWMQGEVHDPRAYELGGIAGHAGLFSTAHDLTIYASMMLGRGEYGGVRILRPETWQEMTKPREVPARKDGRKTSGLRALGWDMQTGFSSNRGANMSPAAFGHGGFTGTALWMDPTNDLFVVFLSNRVHPNGKGSVNPLAGRIGTIAVDAIER